jgi:ribosomal protein S18 acetylase RimI-like enzyme
MRYAFPGAEALGIGFRPERDEDLAFLLALYVSTRAEEVAQTGWPEELQRRFLAQQFEAQTRHYAIHYADAERLVLERDGEAIGRLYLDVDGDMLHILDIALLPESRGAGVGAAILSDLLRQAGEKGQTVAIFVEKNNPARSLYARLGFAAIRDEGVYDFMEWRAGGLPES